jgi:hypothetical protein
MAPSAIQNSSSKTVSKSAKKKKKARAEASEVSTPVAATPEVETPNGSAETGSNDDSSESPYVRELYKYVQFVTSALAELPNASTGTFAASTRRS